MRHALEHLCSANDWFAGAITLGDHHLLRQEHFLRRNLNAKIAARHHNTVSSLNDRVDATGVMNSNVYKASHLLSDALLVLDLGNDLDRLALLAEQLADLAHAIGSANERREDDVDFLYMP